MNIDFNHSPTQPSINSWRSCSSDYDLIPKPKNKLKLKFESKFKNSFLNKLNNGSDTSIHSKSCNSSPLINGESFDQIRPYDNQSSLSLSFNYRSRSKSLPNPEDTFISNKYINHSNNNSSSSSNTLFDDIVSYSTSLNSSIDNTDEINDYETKDDFNHYNHDNDYLFNDIHGCIDCNHNKESINSFDPISIHSPIPISPRTFQNHSLIPSPIIPTPISNNNINRSLYQPQFNNVHKSSISSMCSSIKECIEEDEEYVTTDLPVTGLNETTSNDNTTSSNSNDTIINDNDTVINNNNDNDLNDNSIISEFEKLDIIANNILNVVSKIENNPTMDWGI